MAGVDEFDLDVGNDRHRPVVADRLQLRDRTKRVGFGVERERRGVLGEPVSIGVGRVLFLDASGIGQNDAAEIERPCRAEHATAKPLRHETRQIPAMIEVGMRQHDRIDVGRPNRKRLPIPFAQFLQPLEEPGINQHPGGAGVEQVFGAGHRPRGSQESN